MNKLQNIIIPVIAITWFFLAIIDRIFGGQIGLSYINEKWAPMTIVTSALFILLFSIRLISNSERRKTLFIILGILSSFVLVFGILFEGRVYISSIVTSLMFIILSIHGFYFERQEKLYLRFVLKITVYTTSNIILIIYFFAPQQLFSYPGFGSFSWVTAVGFLLYASTLLSSYYRSLFEDTDLPEDFSIINKKFVIFWFKVSFFTPVLIILTINLLRSFSFLSPESGMGLSLFFVCLLPFPITFLIYKGTVNWNVRIYEKNKKLSLGEEEIHFHNKLLREFAQITSHNLRGPIVSLSNLTKIALDEEISEDIAKRSFELLEEKLPSLLATIDSLADFYNMINTGKILYKTCDLKQIFKEVLTDCKSSYNTNELELNIEIDLDKPTIEYPDIYIRNLFYNLLSNSIKYRKKEGSLDLIVRTKDLESDGIELTFRDNGLGMDLTKFKKSIFKFGKSYHNFSNSKGIGLFILKNQLARLGDTIDVYSEEGKFTEFIIKLNHHGKKELGYS